MITNEYEKFIENDKCNIYPKPMKTTGKSHMIHILIVFKDLKRLMMVVNTESGNTIREYFVNIEELFFEYLKYQCEFYKKNIKDELKEIYNLPHNREYNKLLKINQLEQTLYNRYRVGIVYFICEEDNLFIVKIGYTFNLVERLTQLQTAHYKKLIVKKFYFTQFPYEEEQRLHEKYKDNNIRGEWYTEAE
jgi:hypothetical protein